MQRSKRLFHAAPHTLSSRWTMSLITASALLTLGAPAVTLAQPRGDAAQGDAAQSARVQRARRTVERAQALFAAGQYEAALPEYMRAYEQLRGDPRRGVVLNNIAVCHERAGRYDLAVEFYQRYRTQGDLTSEEHARVRGAIETLENLMGTVRVRSDVPAEIWVDGRPLGRAPGELSLPSGPHLIELHAELYETARRDIVLTARTTVVLAFELSRLSQYRGVPITYAWAAGGLGVAALAAGAVSGWLAKDNDAFGRAHPDFVTPELVDTIQSQQLWANVGFGVGAGLLVTSVVLALLAKNSESEHGSRAITVDATWPRGDSTRGAGPTEAASLGRTAPPHNQRDLTPATAAATLPARGAR